MPRLKIGSAFSLTLLIALLLVAASCGGDDEGGGTVTVGGQKANDHGGQDVSGEGELDLALDDFYFSPTVLTGAAGETLTLHLENEGSRAGIEVVTVPYDEIHKNGGGVHCSTMELVRQPAG